MPLTRVGRPSPVAMRSLHSFTRDEVIRLEGKVEAALEALGHLELLWRALDEHDLLALEQVVVPQVSSFDGLECSERETFLALEARIEHRLRELEVTATTIPLGLSALLERPIIRFPGNPFFRQFDRTGDWLWYGHTAFNVKKVVIERTDGETCTVGGSRVTTAELRRLGIEVPPVVPAAPRPAASEPPRVEPPARPRPLDRRAILRGVGWSIALFVVVLGLMVAGRNRRSSIHVDVRTAPSDPPVPSLDRLPVPSTEPVVSAADVARADFERRRFEALLVTSAPQVLSIARFPSRQPLRPRWRLTETDRPRLLVVETLAPRYLLEHPGRVQFELQLATGEPPRFLDAFALDDQAREVGLSERPQQQDFVVALLFLADQPPSGTARLRAWNGVPSASVSLRHSESTMQLAPTRPPSSSADLFSLLDAPP